MVIFHGDNIDIDNIDIIDWDPLGIHIWYWYSYTIYLNYPYDILPSGYLR